MISILWATLLLAHGALSRWAKSSRFYATVSLVADCILIAAALITIDELQGLNLMETVRIGLFFIAFGTAGRQLMHCVLARRDSI
jgi:hypothetical protein